MCRCKFIFDSLDFPPQLPLLHETKKKANRLKIPYSFCVRLLVAEQIHRPSSYTLLATALATSLPCFVCSGLSVASVKTTQTAAFPFFQRTCRYDSHTLYNNLKSLNPVSHSPLFLYPRFWEGKTTPRPIIIQIFLDKKFEKFCPDFYSGNLS